LDIVNANFGLAIDEKSSGVVLLTALLCVEVCLVEKNTKLLSLGNLLGALEEVFVVVNGLDGSGDVLATILGGIIRLGHIVHGV